MSHQNLKKKEIVSWKKNRLKGSYHPLLNTKKGRVWKPFTKPGKQMGGGKVMLPRWMSHREREMGGELGKGASKRIPENANEEAQKGVTAKAATRRLLAEKNKKGGDKKVGSLARRDGSSKRGNRLPPKGQVWVSQKKGVAKRPRPSL